MNQLPNVAIIGAGLGGLATAARLASRGFQVTVYEQNNSVGGRNSEVSFAGCTFDGGPTLLMMLDPLKRLFSDLGERLEDHLELTLCNPGYRAYYADGSTIESTIEVDQMVKNLQAFGAEKDAEKYPEFLESIKTLYQDAVPNFVESNFQNLSEIASPKKLKMVAKHGMLRNLSKVIEREFSDERVRMLMSFQTMYLGLSPYDAPYVYAVLTYMEYGEGIWYPKGGMPEISNAILKLAEGRGAKFLLNTQITRLEDDSIVDSNGEHYPADIVICNTDLPAAGVDLLGNPPTRKKNSCSALMVYARYDGQLDSLEHHNVVFGSDFKGNLADIFASVPRLPSDPSFYACISSKSDPNRAPEGASNLYLLIPCPNLTYPYQQQDFNDLREKAFKRLSEISDFQPDRISAMQTFTPFDWQSKYGLWQGAAFGLSHIFTQSAFFRPSNRIPGRNGGYFVGASTMPGNGIPMVLISAELVEKRLEQDGYLCGGR